VSIVAETLLSIIREELCTEDIAADDDFYEMGGDSLIAVRVVTRANGAGLPVRLIDLLSHPSAAELADFLAEHAEDGDQGDVAAPTLPELADEFPPGATGLPASALQVGLIYQCEMADDPSLYNDLIGMRVLAPFDDGQFRAALRRLVDRHAALRTSFDLGGYSDSVALVWPEIESSLEIDRAESDGGTELAEWRERQLSTFMDWTRAPLFRCHVAVLDDSFLLTFAIHHAIMDGWSFATTLVDLLTFYDAELSGVDSGLPDVPADGQSAFLAAERAAAALPESAAFWRAQADLRPLLLDRERFGVPVNSTARQSFQVDPGTLRQLRRAAAEIKVPLKDVLLAVHCWALGQWAGRSGEIVTGVVMNGRPEIEGSELLVGLFLNTVPLRFPLSGDTWAERATAVRDVELSAVPHRRYPLAAIEDDLGRRSFDVAYNFTDFHVYRRLGALERVKTDGWWAVDKASHVMSCDYTVDFPGFGSGLMVSYDPALVAAERVRELLDVAHAGLRSAASDIHGDPSG
jgi:hypothetical protein